ncbi:MULTISPECIES: 4Fe-4S dicluster domain-containing protein [unclassified Pseudodesulfovibrio]|uniref:4Fe-4S dicluster domain-containing protein n=1 Tax=unclassified Pseudodesulfovibrio TaxID=2661612 RepID=UPI000FEB90DF|nr:MULTISPECIES: 4Fe-4S dicluster domain-containing protein [unclassified Pseudodesulfovibrio]MCJ2165302.1 4Fe-4S dicluster domain-containing protein [Pseudodesulfovibrio sp. S3-i]RWU02462.1 hydrogenase [Pseudodesulfovibrio sp. S3]
MLAARYITTDKLVPWLLSLSESRLVLAPIRKGGQTVFQPLEADSELDLDGLATSSPKAALLPRCETLLEFHYSKGEEAPSRTSVEVRETLHDQPTFLFGARPCDVRGFTVFDRVYDAGSKRDIYYCTRRDNTLVASLACTDPAETCFCHRVGGGPGDSTGADLLFTFIGDGYVVEAVTDRGNDFLLSQTLHDAGDRVETALKTREAVKAAMPEGEPLLGAPEQVNKLFDDQPFWEDVSAKCLSCGACSYLCPTCYCFNMTDEMHGNDGVRVRTWDNCMSFQFTLEGSGHNPRAAKAQRMRNRIGHKFNYYPALHDGNLACVGCGRCISHCPVSMDVREIVSKAQTRAMAEEEQIND